MGALNWVWLVVSLLPAAAAIAPAPARA